MTFQPKIFRSKHDNSKTSSFKTDDPLFFKDFPAKNIPFENASPKNGKFIDWDFTSTVLGDANGVLLAFFFNMRIFVVASYNRVLVIL